MRAVSIGAMPPAQTALAQQTRAAHENDNAKNLLMMHPHTIALDV
jgi:hypothetical protein